MKGLKKGIEKMKILLATFWHMPVTGGIASYLTHLKNGLERLGHTVDTFGQQRGVKGSYTVNAVPILSKQSVRKLVAQVVTRYLREQAPETPSRIKIQEIDRCSFELAASYLELGEYDIIHCQDVISAIAFSRVKPESVPLVTTVHGCFTYELYLMGVLTERDMEWHYQAEQESRGIRGSDVTIVPTHWLRTLLSERFDIPVHNMEVIPYGIDIDDFEKHMSQTPKLKVPANKTLIVCPARLDPVKGHTVLLSALAQLKRRRTDWICLLLGDGPIRRKLEIFSRRLGLEGRVFFVGNRHDVPSILRQADVVVLPSLQDNQPFAVMEAQLAGRPIVVSDAGGIPEMVTHRETGLVFPKGKSEQLAEHLTTLLDDPEWRVRLGQNSRLWAQRQWPLSRMLEQTVDLYTLALKCQTH